jgi:hypothetical protein
MIDTKAKEDILKILDVMGHTKYDFASVSETDCNDMLVDWVDNNTLYKMTKDSYTLQCD